MGKKAYMGPMQDPNGINAQILPIWVPYIHVCWDILDLRRLWQNSVRRLIMKCLLRSFLFPSGANVSFWRKNLNMYLLNAERTKPAHVKVWLG